MPWAVWTAFPSASYGNLLLDDQLFWYCTGTTLLSKEGSSGSSGSMGRAASFPPHKAKGIPAARHPSQPLPESKLQT